MILFSVDVANKTDNPSLMTTLGASGYLPPVMVDELTTSMYLTNADSGSHFHLTEESLILCMLFTAVLN